MKRPKSVGIQYAALPYRQTGRRLEILLITSRESRRWVIPKGWPMDGLRPEASAAAEAAEEAGIVGVAEAQPIGSYRYLKRLKNKTIPIQVIVFPFAVNGRSDHWKEHGQRATGWFTCAKASTLVTEPSLKRLIREFGRSKSLGLHHAASRITHWLRGALAKLGG